MARPRIAYIGLSLELYLSSRQEAKDGWHSAFARWRNVMASRFELACSAFCYTDSDMAAIAKRIEETDVDAVVISAASYTGSLLSVPVLERLGLPVVIWSTQDAETIRPDYAPFDLTLNHTVQGIHDVANLLWQRGIPFDIVTGHWQDEEALARLERAVAVARAWKKAKSIKVLSLGGQFVGMGDFAYDARNLREVWGPQVEDLPVADFLAAVAAVPDAEVDKEEEQDRARFAVQPDLARETHRESIRRKLALDSLLATHGATAFTMNFTALLARPGFGQLPFYAINCLMGEGMGYAGEGDALRAAWMRELHLLCGPANFTEIYTVDFRANRFFMTHMQECSVAVARRDRKIVLKNMPFWARGGVDYTGMFFSAEPGECTLASITPDGHGGFRIIAFAGEIPDLPPYETFNRAHWIFQCRGKAATVLDNYSLAGGPHHLAAVYGNRIPQMQALARRHGFDFIDITEDFRHG